jgi:hypothetical protein
MSKGLPGGITQPGAGFTRPFTAFNVDDASIGHPGRGLPRYKACFLSSSGACTVRLTVGSLDGGEAAIDFTLTRRGAWIDAASWGNAKLEILSCDSATHVFRWQFSTERPPQTPERLTLIREETAGTFAVPVGAVGVTLETADPTWGWSTDATGAGAVTLAQAIPATTKVDVLGASYAPSIANSAVWWIDPL